MQSFGVLNWTILALYIAGTLVLGFFFSRKISSADDFYLGRRRTPWWAIGVSVVATYVSALSFLGAPAWSYTDGLSVIVLHMTYPLVVFAIITYFLPFFFNSGVASIYDYQERRFGAVSRMTISLLFLVSQALTSAAILYATSLVIQFITGIDVIYAIVLVTIIALIYTALGGITAVIWTDVMQAAILFIGACLILYALLDQLPVPLPDALSELKTLGKTNPFDFDFDLSREATIWSGVFGMTLYHITVYGANQMMVQRTLASKSIGDAKKAFLMMGYGAFFIYFLFFLLGILFYGYYGGREFDNGNTIILHFAAEYSLPGLMGVLAAAVVAASMSSMDSAFNSMATISVVDFYQKYFKKDGSPQHYLKASRVFTIFWAIAIIIPAIVYSRTEGSILPTLSKVGSYFVGAKLSMFGLGFFSKHTTERGLLVGVAVGFMAVWLVATHTDIAWPWYCLIGATVNVAVALPASILLDGLQTEYSSWTIRGQLDLYRRDGRPEKENGWYLVPGKVDRSSYFLLLFYLATYLSLFGLNALIE